MSVLDLKNMTLEEKLMAMEELWEDMSKTANSNEYITPDWHKEQLDERERKVADGEASFFSIDEVKKEFRSRK